MANLLLILALLFAILFILVKVLDGRAQPLSAEQQARLSKWLMIAVFLSIVLSLFKTLV
jgi:hypothetical protein